MISLRRNEDFQRVTQLPGKEVPEVELVTLIDISTLWEDKQELAIQMARQIVNLNHKNLLNITQELRHLQDDSSGSLLEFASEAPDHINSWKCFCKKPFTLEQNLSIFRQLCCAVRCMHESNFVFRDVHPTRIHCNNGVIKLNMVGMPYNFKKLLKNENFSGHLNYSAPEILENGPENVLTPKIDVWSLGCCLYYLVTKRDPFDEASPARIKANIRHGRLDRYDYEIGKDDRGNPRHPIIEQLLEACLTADYELRPNINELIDLIDEEVYLNREILKTQNKFAKTKKKQPDLAGLKSNKLIPEFFVKRNSNEPVEIEELPFDEILAKFQDKQNLQSQSEEEFYIHEQQEQPVLYQKQITFAQQEDIYIHSEDEH